MPFPGGDLWLARQHFSLAGLVPKRRFADQKSDAKVFAARAHSFCVLEGQDGFVASLPDLATGEEGRWMLAAQIKILLYHGRNRNSSGSKC